MSRQIQIRRGTADQHKTFTGAQGELTMDTTNNTLRLHDGATPGGVALARADSVPAAAPIPDNYDFVIESWISADNNTWYRKYKSGWVEQGGIFNAATGSNYVDLPLAMLSADYVAGFSAVVSSSNARNVQMQDVSTNTRLYFICNSAFRVCWQVKGFCQ